MPYCLFTDPPPAHVGLSEREAGEVLATVQTAMLGGLPYTIFEDAILTHPTMAEGLNELFAAVPGAAGRIRRAGWGGRISPPDRLGSIGPPRTPEHHRSVACRGWCQETQ